MSHATPFPTRSIRARDLALALVATLALLLPSVVVAPAADASHDGTWVNAGGFEIDGDAAQNHSSVASPTIDWLTVPGGIDFTDSDAAGSATDDSFIGGAKDDEVPTLGFTSGSVPGKADLVDVWVESKVATSPAFAWLWVAFSRLDIQGQGDVHANFEFNQSEDTVTVNSSPIPVRTDGDLLVTYDYSGGQSNVEIEIYYWDDDNDSDPVTGDWVLAATQPDAYGDVNFLNEDPKTGGVPCDPTDAATRATACTLSPDGVAYLDHLRFAEAGINLLQIIQGNPQAGCDFNSFWVKSRSSGEGNDFSPQLKDLMGPYDVDVDLCSRLRVQKQDAELNGLSGAKFELWKDRAPLGQFSAQTDLLIVVDDSTDPDTTHVVTGSDGWAEWTGLAPGGYFVREIQAPTGYLLSSTTVSGPHTIDYLSDVAVPSGTFVNPRRPYRIDVSPHTDVNPIGANSLHTFTVHLQQGTVANPASDADWEHVADETPVSVSWAPTDGTSAIVTNGCAAGTTDGTCTVTVDADVPEAGTLTATFDTPYQHVTGTFGPPDPPTAAWVSTLDAGTALDEIADAADKGWRGFLAEIGDDGVNLVGESHPFTVHVWETADGTTKGDDASGVTATLRWTAPGGATTDLSCETDGTGTCTVNRNSSVTGTGFIQVTQLDGQINGQDITITYTPASADPGPGTDDRFATKTWVDLRVSISPESATNLVDWDHTFVVTVERDSGSGWARVNDVDLTPEWKAPGAAGFVDLAACTTGTNTVGDQQLAGTCLVTVDGGTLGTGTLRVTSLDGAPLSDDVSREGPIDVTDATATKTWVDYGVIVTPSGTNLVGEPHDFTVTVSRSDDPADLSGIEVDWTWSGPSGSTVDDDVTSSGTCTTDASGECTLQVNSTSAAGTGVLTVTGLTDSSVSDADNPAATVTFDPVEDPDASETDNAASKTWVAFAVSIDPPTATNHVDDDHTFVITVTRDSGSGPVPVNGVTLTPDWWGPRDDAFAPLDEGCTTGTNTIGELELDGTCLVTVPGGSTGTGTLRVTELDGAPLAEGVTRSTPIDVADATATKTWVDYDASISADSVNLVGEDHEFVVTASRDDGAGMARADGLTVTVAWTDGPAGSELVGSDTCTTSTHAEHGVGVCVFTVTSTSVGTGTLHVVSVSEDIADAPGGSLIETFAQAGDDEAIAATKTWVSFMVRISPDDANNHVDDDHRFTFTVTRLGGPNDPTSVTGAVVTPEWQAQGSDEWVPIDGCTTTAGTCSIDVPSGGQTGTGTIRVTSLGGAPLSSTVTRDVSFGGDAVDGDSATKTWHDYEADVSGAARNVLGDAHEFIVTAYRDSGAGFVATDGLEVTVDWDDLPEGSTIDATTCTTDTHELHGPGTCVFTVDSDSSIGRGTITVLSVRDPDTLDPSELALSETFGEGDDSEEYPKTSTKTWVGWTVDAIGSFFNPVGVPHTFTITVWEHDGVGNPVHAADGTVVHYEVGGTVGVVVGAGTTCGTGTVGGTCTIEVTSPVPGTLTVTVDEVSGTFEDEPFSFPLRPLTVEGQEGSQQGSKTWGDFAVTVEPDGVNPIETTHTFTVTTYGSLEPLGEDEDLPLLGGQLVELVLSGSATEVTDPSGSIVSVDGELVEATSATCTTAADTATCTVVITSATVGTDHLHAFYTPPSIQPSEGEPVVFTDAGRKDWVSNPRIEVTKTATITRAGQTVDGPARVGDVIRYSYTVFNAGDVRLVNVTLTDVYEISGGTGPTVSLLSSPIDLAVGERRVLGVLNQHVVREADLPGPIDNVVTARGTSPDGQQVSDTAEQSVPLTFSPSISLTKEADVETAGPGDDITYTYIITNTGDVTLTNVDLVDDVLGTILGGPGDSVVTLAPGGRLELNVTQTVTEADLPGPIVNTAITTGTPPVGPDVDATANESVDLVIDPSIDVTKTPSVTGATVGEVITYTYVVTNTGDVTLTDVTAVDDLLGPITLGATTLAPGASTDGTLQHTVVGADLPGPIVNVVTATGTPPLGPDVDAEAEAQVSLTSNPSITVDKEAAIEADAEGLKLVALDLTDGDDETVVYEYVVTNTGDVTLTDIVLVDDVLGPITLESTTLEPGASTIGAAIHVVTQDDFDFGSIDNIADVSGVGPDGTVVRDQDTEQVFVTIVLPSIIERPEEPAPLPATGANSWQLGAIALGTMALGALLLQSTSRRRVTV